MPKNIHKLFLIFSFFSLLVPHAIFTQNPRLYISVMSKLAQKKDFFTTLENIVTVINETQNEKIDPDTIKSFIQSDNGKKLNNSFSNSLNNSIFQMPVTTIGLFLYDFYQLNIFKSYTQIIGKAFEQYLFNLHNISTKTSFSDVISPKDFVKKHRPLHNETIIHETYSIIQKSIELIHSATIEQLTNVDYLEHDLLPKLGFDGKKSHEFPEHLHKYKGTGLQSWQYPSQLAKLLISLSQEKVDTYLETGTQHGGTFIIVTEYLKRFNPEIKSYALDSYYYLMLDLYVNEINPNAEYILDFANSKRFINISNINLDVASIDGDPSFEGTTELYNLIKKNSNIIIINDIVNDLCPRVGSLWSILKKIYAKNSKVEEITDQYDDVMKRQNQKYLGIGIIKKSKLNKQ
jgi:hypothetical protein